MTVSDLDIGTVGYIVDTENDSYQGYMIASKTNDCVQLFPTGDRISKYDLPDKAILFSEITMQEIYKKIPHNSGWNSDILDKLLGLDK